MKFIFNCIRFIFRLIWRLIWGLIWSVALSFLVLVGVFYFTTSTETGAEGLSQALRTTVTQVDQFLTKQGLSTGFQTSEGIQPHQLTDEHKGTGARWEKASATVYIDTTNETLRSAYQEAINSWNQTGAFTFQIINDKEEADIIATEMNDGSVSAAGEAESKTNLLTNRFTHTADRHKDR